MRTQVVYTNPDVDTLDIGNIDLTMDCVVWSRGGERRKIGKPMIEEAARLYIDGLRMVTAGRLPALPPEWGRIYWGSCTPIVVPTPVLVTKTSDGT